ncbi:MAG: OmpA family protein [Methylotenera sp.]|nr:OmpA family protein [Methylotenera sp.]
MNQHSKHHSSGHLQPRYNLWTWVVAVLLALILLWMLFTGRGPSTACCGALTETPAASAMSDDQAASTSDFSFSASNSGLTSSGDGKNIAWLSQADKLSNILNDENLLIQGNDKNVVLSGSVESEAIKQQIGTDAQVFFGSGVVVDNQLVVIASDESMPAVPPATIKLYFDSGKTTLPSDASISLAAMIHWLKTHPESKAILSGYHDPKGDKALNEELAKERAESVEDVLEDAGIDDDRIDKRKPQSVDGGADLAEARRVEISIE